MQCSSCRVLLRSPDLSQGRQPVTMNPDELHSASRIVHFTDRRSPHEMRCALERDHMTGFEPVMQEGRLEFHGVSKCNGLPCTFRLVFEAAGWATNEYTLHLQISWAHLPPEHHDYYRKTSVSWFDLWCRDLKPHAPLPAEPPTGTYQARVEQALDAESHLTDISAIQQAILTALRSGASFSTAHKEGGTNIGHAQGRFFRRDYGESNAQETFAADASFLAFLRKFFDWETSRNVAPAKVSDETAWRLILRLLHPA